MSKSLVQMVNELFTRVAALEAKAREMPAVTIITPVELDIKPPETNRKMCPKCGVKPNHFFHVKTCKGQQKEQKNGEDAVRRRDQGTT